VVGDRASEVEEQSINPLLIPWPEEFLRFGCRDHDGVHDLVVSGLRE
jgi:hypothetical protein